MSEIGPIDRTGDRSATHPVAAADPSTSTESFLLLRRGRTSGKHPLQHEVNQCGQDATHGQGDDPGDEDTAYDPEVERSKAAGKTNTHDGAHRDVSRRNRHAGA